MNILVLKELKGLDDPYKLALKELGDIHFIPVLSIRFINQKELQNLLIEENFTSIIFTSGNAVKAMKEAFKSIQSDTIDSCRQMKCYAVGKATQKSANELGFKCRGSTSGNAEELAKLIIEENLNSIDENYLFPCGQMKREILPAMLKDAGFSLKSVTVYETTADPDIHQQISKFKCSLSKSSLIVFFSPSGVKFSLPGFRDAYRDDFKELHFAAIGKTTAEALEKEGITPCCVAEHPTPEDLARAIRAFWKTYTNG